jgi:hypothetical protein
MLELHAAVLEKLTDPFTPGPLFGRESNIVLTRSLALALTAPLSFCCQQAKEYLFDSRGSQVTHVVGKIHTAEGSPVAQQPDLATRFIVGFYSCAPCCSATQALHTI